MMHSHRSLNQRTASASPPQPVPLKEWTSGIVDFLRSIGEGGEAAQQNKILCSSQYLSCALKIAHSLADQMSTVEEERGYKQKRPYELNNNNSPPLIETIEKSWSEYISVYCAEKAMEEKKDEISVNNNVHNSDNCGDGHISVDTDFEPLPYDGDDFEPEDFQNLAKHLSTTLLFENDNKQLQVDYLDVRGAILNEGAVDDRPLSDNGKLEIRSLGIAFYELFSGGQVTASSTQRGLKPDRGDELSIGERYFCGSNNDNESENHANEGNPTKRRAQSNHPIDYAYQKTMLSRSSSASTSISVEPLKMLGLPIALCDLICNMIDSTYGDTNGNAGTYEFVSEVRDDLKLMIDSPQVYLYDFDLGEATQKGLQFGSSLYGRETELKTLLNSYHRAISSQFELALICGTSGIGKSELSRKFAQSASQDGECIFLSGRFDRLQSQPLHAISSAFGNYCASLSAKDPSTAEKVSAALKESIGGEVASLVTAMPSLANILGGNFDSKQSDDAVDAQKRLRYLFCQFVQIISECHEEPLILFLDDCQWIDAASAGLLIQLAMSVTTLKYRRFFFFMSCRDDEMSETHPLNLVLSSVNSLGINTTRIHLAPLSKGALNEMVSATLSLLPRITRPFADILHHKTKGGPLFAKQLMMELYKQRLLYPSLSRRRWDWEADKISDMKIPETVATFITKSFDRLPSDVLSALVVLSCFGASADVSMIEVLEKEIQQSLVVPLEAAVAESVLGKKDGKFYFMHDKLQEAAYGMMEPKERCLHHNLYGQALGFVVLRENDDRFLLIAATQINLGGPEAVIDNDQAKVVAKLNLDAGKKAMGMSDFFSAHTFFNYGISYLREGHWDDQYDLSLELFTLAASCALLNAEHGRVHMLTAEVFSHAKGIEDKFRAICMSITLLLWASKLPEAMEKIHTTLSCFGEELPLATPESVVQRQANDTKALLAGLSDEALLSYPAMTIPSKIMAMELFSKQFINYTFSGNRDAMPIVPLKMVQTSLMHGMSPLAGVGFALYGNYLSTVRGENQEGYRYVKLALALSKRMPSTGQDSEIMYYAAHTKLRIEPIQSSMEYYSETYKAAMAAGAARFAFGCSFMYDLCSFYSGKYLDLVISSMNVTRKQMIFYKNFVMLGLLQPFYRISLRLTGQTDVNQRSGLTNVFGESYNEEEASSKLPMVVLTACVANMCEGVFYQDFERARDSIQKYISIQSLTAANMSNSTDFWRTFYAGLASLWVSRELGDKGLLKRGAECVDAIETLAVTASEWNFQNKLYLLQAEKQFCERNFDEAETLYDAAILSAKTHKFANEEALANELAGRFYLETGRRNKARHYYSQAFEKYNEWGAVAKAASLTQYFDGNSSGTVRATR